ncbi:xanthine dehydrogenase family protein molybdopterin-binding subunit [Streptomyces sp. NPDC048172]|uniref:xanthine dehydrogenase family protein molybdopterin-binding subunit n=1 Tax=Streptomyces sp. NPDC048172 TaxID=3365505 RepID=UPI00371119BA
MNPQVSAPVEGLRRPDGPAKLTGAARYVADVPAADALVGTFVCATVPRAERAVVDAGAARRAPGVVAVLTADELPQPGYGGGPVGQSVLPMTDHVVRYEGQPVALVLADTGERSRYAAELVGVAYEGVRSAVVFADAEDSVESMPMMGPADHGTGDVGTGLAAARTVVSETYATSDRHHNPIEPSATLARWDGDQLTVHDSVQSISATQAVLANAFGLDPGQVRVICPYVGGGFGCKGYIWPHQVLAAAAARAVGRAVRLPLTRAQMFTSCGHQPETRQTVTLGADADGRLTALRHHSVNATSRYDQYAEATTDACASLYASPHIELRRRIRHTDRATPTPMRSPHEGPGLFALESAVDELAYAVGLDPLAFRLRNLPERDALTGAPFSSHGLRECLKRGAERFGWARRAPGPRATREGDELVGLGMATVSLETHRMPSSARVVRTADGRVRVEAGTEEIGTGQPGVLATVAAEVLDVRPEDVEVVLGDTRLPATGMTAGSSATMGLGSAVLLAARAVKEKLAGGAEEAEAEATWGPQEGGDGLGRKDTMSVHAYGAVFVEVRVDALLGRARVARCLGAYAAGRIINPLAARGQMTGGLTWGIGHALLERSRFDAEFGRFASKNLAGYAVPVTADVPEVDVLFVDDHDAYASPLGAKGIGELGPLGVSAAVANAVFHATGIRVRELPIGIPDLLEGLPLA